MYSLDYEGGPFSQMLSFAEAAAIWNKDQSTLRKAVIDGRLKPGRDCCKFGKQWVVTVEAMQREFGGWAPWSTHLADLRKEKLTQEIS